MATRKQIEDAAEQATAKQTGREAIAYVTKYTPPPFLEQMKLELEGYQPPPPKRAITTDDIRDAATRRTYKTGPTGPTQ